MSRNIQVVNKYGKMWARNTANISRIPLSKELGGIGIYILYDGSMPVYIGKGKISERIKSARTSKRRGQFWDRFSWYGLANPKTMHDIEVLALKMFPRYLRSLTNQDGNFFKAEKERDDKRHKIADVISRKARKRKR
jgi:hypothetical protein